MWGYEPVSTRIQGTGTIRKRGRSVLDPEGDALVQPANERERHQSRQRGQGKSHEDSGLHPCQRVGRGVEDAARILSRVRFYEHYQPTERSGSPPGGSPSRSSEKGTEAVLQHGSHPYSETGYSSNGPAGGQQSSNPAPHQTCSEIAGIPCICRTAHRGSSHSFGSFRYRFACRNDPSGTIRHGLWGLFWGPRYTRVRCSDSTGNHPNPRRASPTGCNTTSDNTRRSSSRSGSR